MHSPSQTIHSSAGVGYWCKQERRRVLCMQTSVSGVQDWRCTCCILSHSQWRCILSCHDILYHCQSLLVVVLGWGKLTGCSPVLSPSTLHRCWWGRPHSSTDSSSITEEDRCVLCTDDTATAIGFTHNHVMCKLTTPEYHSCTFLSHLVLYTGQCFILTPLFQFQFFNL